MNESARTAVPARTMIRIARMRLREPECNHFAADHARYVLLPVLALIRHRIRAHAGVQLDFPELLAGLRIEGPEAGIARGRKQQTARGGGGSGAADGTHVLLAFGKAFVDPQHDLPGDIAGVGVDRVQMSPWWLVAGHTHDGEAAVRTRSRDAPAIVGLGRSRAASVVAAWHFLFDPTRERSVVRRDKHVAVRRIGCRAAPVRRAHAGQLERALRRRARFMERERSERSLVEIVALLEQLLARSRVFGRGV